MRVKVLAAGVSFADILMRKGVHPESWNLGRIPFTPGWDVVGVVDKLGDKVSTWQIGQMVAALPIVGGYADAVFDSIGGRSLSLSYDILRSGGRLVAYGGTPTTDLQDWLIMLTLNLIPDKRKFMLYSIQTLKS